MWKKLYSSSGLILLAVLAVGIWFSNLLPFFSTTKAPEYANPDATSVVSETPTPTPITIEDLLSATARCKDGTLSYSSSKQAACSRHGGIAQWFPPLKSR